MTKETKTCVVCKKPMEWRKNGKNWNEVKYCSEGVEKIKKIMNKAAFVFGDQLTLNNEYLKVIRIFQL